MRRWLALGLSFSILLACDRREASPPSTEISQSDESGNPQFGGTLFRRLDSDVTTLNPVRHTTESEKLVLGMLFDPLVTYDRELNIVPKLALSWEVSPDGRLFTFKLDPAATWSDGQPVRSSDVVFTLRKIIDPQSGSVQLGPLFEGLDLANTKAIDPTTVQVAFTEARAGILGVFNIPIVPEHVYGKGDFTKDFDTRVVGNGPYRFASREPGKQIIVERRQDYGADFKPYIDKIVFRVVEDDSVAWNALKLGEIDESRINSDTWKLEKDTPQVQKAIDIHRFYSLSYNFIPWNTKDPLLRDKRVRRALSMALDRRAIITNLYFGTARIMTGPFTPDQFAYDPSVPPVEFDIEGSRRLLNEAGWSDSNGDGVLDRNGKPLEIELLLSAGNKAGADLAPIYQDALKKVGVTLKVAKTDAPTFFQRILEGKYQGAYLGWNVEPDPDIYSLFHSTQTPPNGQNVVFYSNPEVDRLLEATRKELDPQKRLEIFHELHRILADEQPYTWTVQVSVKWGVNRRVKNVNESKGLGLFFWDPGPREWWIPASQRRNEAPPAAK